MRPLDLYALSVSVPLEKLVSLIVRRRTNRGSTVIDQFKRKQYLKKRRFFCVQRREQVV